MRNWIYYGDATGLNTLLDIIGRRDKGFGLLDFLPETEGIRWSYWALFGWFNLPVADWMYRVYDAFLLVALAGLIVFCVVATRARRWAVLGGGAFAAAWFLTVLVALVNLNLVTIVAQGRLLFPAASVVSILLVRGWQQWLPAQRVWARALSWGAAIAMFALALAVPFTIIAPAYAAPDALTAEQAASQVLKRLKADFEDKLTLIGISVDHSEVHPGDVFWISACWHGEQKLSEDYFVFVQLLADDDLIAAQKDTYHGLGIYRALALRPPESPFVSHIP